jgi:hypothetical protein
MNDQELLYEALKSLKTIGQPSETKLKTTAMATAVEKPPVEKASEPEVSPLEPEPILETPAQPKPSEPTKPTLDPEARGIPYTQCMDDQLIRIFAEHGTLKQPARITAATVQDGLDKSLNNEARRRANHDVAGEGAGSVIAPEVTSSPASDRERFIEQRSHLWMAGVAADGSKDDIARDYLRDMLPDVYERHPGVVRAALRAHSDPKLPPRGVTAVCHHNDRIKKRS